MVVMHFSRASSSLRYLSRSSEPSEGLAEEEGEEEEGREREEEDEEEEVGGEKPLVGPDSSWKRGSRGGGGLEEEEERSGWRMGPLGPVKPGALLTLASLCRSLMAS